MTKIVLQRKQGDCQHPTTTVIPLLGMPPVMEWGKVEAAQYIVSCNHCMAHWIRTSPVIGLVKGEDR